MIKTYQTNSQETDTYQKIRREEKEGIDNQTIKKHWETRAKRLGVQAVMSARHTLEENIEATYKLQKEITELIGHRIKGNVVELGTGIGRMTPILAERANKVVTCDLSETMINRAKQNLAKYNNIEYVQGKIFSIEGTYDSVFDSIVLLHILDPEELKATAEKMKSLSDRIFICEHTFEGEGFPISKYSILRKPEEYAELFKPYRLAQQRTHLCAGDKFILMSFEKELQDKDPARWYYLLTGNRMHD